jgi:hypothetical protein
MSSSFDVIRASRPRTTTGTPPPRIAVTRLRRVSRPATDRRLCVGSDVPIENPWTHRRPALPQGALSAGDDEKLAVMPMMRHAQTGSDQPIRIVHLALRCLVARVLG